MAFNLIEDRDFEVRDGLLFIDGEPCEIQPTKKTIRGRIDPRYVVLHYTGGTNFRKSVELLAYGKRKASSHFVVGRGGEVCQISKTHKGTWHAGKSKWGGLVGMNRYSVGIEIVNAGYLKEVNGTFRTWYDAVIPESQVHFVDGKPWHAYTDEQIAAVVELCGALKDAHSMGEEYIVRHSDIAPRRKVDPGKAFPFDQVVQLAR